MTGCVLFLTNLTGKLNYIAYGTHCWKSGIVTGKNKEVKACVKAVLIPDPEPRRHSCPFFLSSQFPHGLPGCLVSKTQYV